MAKQTNSIDVDMSETDSNIGENLDLSDVEVKVVLEKPRPSKIEEIEEVVNTKPAKETICCLTDKKVTVRFIPKDSGLVNNPKHIFYGNMAENALRTFTVPILESSGSFVNVLTTDEKNYLEEAMGLQSNALSVHLRKDNFWENYKVTLGKGDTILSLSDPYDYIKYKVLKANKDFIAGSLAEKQDHPKATYQYVMIIEEEEVSEATQKMSTTMRCYMELGAIKDDQKLLRMIVEMLDSKPIAANTKIEFLQIRCNENIQRNPKLFLNTVQDKLLPTKVLIRECAENGLISRRGNQYYLKSDGSPLCLANEEPTLNIAAKFLNLVKNQELKISLEAKLKSLR